jgi:hypothetical protein
MFGSICNLQQISICCKLQMFPNITTLLGFFFFEITSTWSEGDVQRGVKQEHTLHDVEAVIVAKRF